MKKVAVETPIGILNGRDAIYLDEVNLREGKNTLCLQGEFNGKLASKVNSAGFIKYRMIFKRMVAMKMVELDSWDWRKEKSESSFDEDTESYWIKELGGKISSGHRHFCIQTYDQVFDVVCEDYEIEML